MMLDVGKGAWRGLSARLHVITQMSLPEAIIVVASIFNEFVNRGSVLIDHLYL